MDSCLTLWGSPSESKKKALLIHGLSSTGQAYWRMARVLTANGIFCCAPDLLHHGFRTDEAGQLTYQDFAKDIYNNCYKQFAHFDYIIGHSLGGPITAALLKILLEVDTPRLPERVILLDPVMRLPGDQYDDLIQGQIQETKLTTQDWMQKNPDWQPVDCLVKEMGGKLIRPNAIQTIFKAKMPDADEYIPAKLPPGLSCDLILLAADGNDPVLTEVIARDIIKTHGSWARAGVMRHVNHGGILRSKPDLVAKLLLDGKLDNIDDFTIW